MSDNHQEGPDPGSEELSDESYDEATVKLSHEDGDVAGEPAHDQTQHIPAFQEESTEDGEVYVILPDGEGGDIPVIETEVVDEAGGLLDKAPLSLEDLEDVPIRDSNPLFEATQIDEAADGFAQTENLDELASELDDDLLGGTEAVCAEGSESEMFDEDDVFDSTSDDEAGERAYYSGVDHVSSSGGSRRSKILLPVAAALLLGVGGYFAYVSYWLPRSQGVGDGGSVAVSGTHAGVQAGTSATIPAGTDPAGDVTAAAGGSSVAGSDPVSGAANLVVASREAFREKFLLAIERGYGGSVTDE